MAVGKHSRGLVQHPAAQICGDILLLALAVVGLLSIGPLLHTQDPTFALASKLLVPGFILLVGVFGGRVAGHIHLPHLTGYLLMGVLIGPQSPIPGLSLLAKGDLDHIRFVQDLAVGLIALMAGVEIRMAWLRARLRGILSVVAWQTALIPLALFTTVMLLWSSMPFAASVDAAAIPSWVVAVLIGMIALANSPMVVISVIKETKAQGPLSETAMGVSVFKDVVVILGFTIALAVAVSFAQQADVAVTSKQTSHTGSVVASAVLGPTGTAGAAEVIATQAVEVLSTHATELDPAVSAQLAAAEPAPAVHSADASASNGAIVAQAGAKALYKIAISIGLGLLLGYLLRIFTQRSDFRLTWILVGLATLVAAVEPWGIKSLFCLLAAGFACENIGPRTERGTHRVESALARVAAPVFVLFFVAAGLKLHVHALIDAFGIIALLVGVRAVAVFVSVKIAAKMSGLEQSVRRNLWAAMIPQAGVSISLVTIIAGLFPVWGGELQTVIIAGIAIHELVGPVIFALALRRAGEAAH